MTEKEIKIEWHIDQPRDHWELDSAPFGQPDVPNHDAQLFAFFGGIEMLFERLCEDPQCKNVEDRRLTMLEHLNAFAARLEERHERVVSNAIRRARAMNG